MNPVCIKEDTFYSQLTLKLAAALSSKSVCTNCSSSLICISGSPSSLLCDKGVKEREPWLIGSNLLPCKIIGKYVSITEN